MENKDLERLSTSLIVQCPNKDCKEYGCYNGCYTHAYTICDQFIDWYEGLSSDQIRELYDSNY